VDVTWSRIDIPEYRDEYYHLTDAELFDRSGSGSIHAWLPFLN